MTGEEGDYRFLMRHLILLTAILIGVKYKIGVIRKILYALNKLDNR